MARAASAGPAHVSKNSFGSPNKAKLTTVGSASSKSMSAPQAQANSHRVTTAPKVKQPAVTFVKDTKARTAREVLVDGYNNANPATPGGRNKLTELEREYKLIAANRDSGAESTMPGRPKQAQ